MKKTAATIVTMLVLAGCGSSQDGAARPVEVVATTAVAGDLARAVGGRRAEVRTLMRANTDPHDFEPRPSDARALAGADVLVVSGGALDDWVGGLVDAVGFEGEQSTLFDALAPVSEDPHWWHDPRNGIRAVAQIQAALMRADPQGRGVYERNARAYTQRLRRLDRSIASCIRRVTASERKLVTTHDALGYYARRYDIEVVGALIPSLSTQAQPSGRDVQELVGQIRSEGVKAVFPESALSPRLERAVSREAGVNVGGELWADTLGPRGSGAETYLGSLSANTATLAEGMSGGAVHCRPGA